MASFKEHPNLKFWFVFIYFLFDVKVKHFGVKSKLVKASYFVLDGFYIILLMFIFVLFIL